MGGRTEEEEEDSEALGLCLVIYVCKQPSCGIRRFVLLSQLFFLCATNADTAAKASIKGLTTSWGWRRKRAEIQGVMLVTSDHRSMADPSCEAGRAMASFDSVSAEGAVIHL